MLTALLWLHGDGFMSAKAIVLVRDDKLLFHEYASSVGYIYCTVLIRNKHIGHYVSLGCKESSC